MSMIVNEGKSVSRSVKFTEEMVLAFSKITGDRAPVHFSAKHANEMGFKSPIVHGFLISSIYSEMLGCRLPGANSVIQKTTIDFLAPVFVGQKVRFSVLVARVSEATGGISLKLSAYNDNDELVNRGTAVCIMRQENSKSFE